MGLLYPRGEDSGCRREMKESTNSLLIVVPVKREGSAFTSLANLTTYLFGFFSHGLIIPSTRKVARII
jgi:hypothetical protein